MKTTFASNIKKTAAAFACALTVFTAAASSTVGASEYFYHEYNGYPASDQTVCCFYTPGYSSLKFVVEDGSKTIDHRETVDDDGTASIREITTVYYNDRTEKTTVTIKQTYTVRWLDGDGSVLQTKTYAEGDPVPTYTGEEPTKAPTAQSSYAFTGWDEGTADGTTTTYKPLFDEEVRSYAITFDLAGGTLDGKTGSITWTRE